MSVGVRVFNSICAKASLKLSSRSGRFLLLRRCEAVVVDPVPSVVYFDCKGVLDAAAFGELIGGDSIRLSVEGGAHAISDAGVFTQVAVVDEEQRAIVEVLLVGAVDGGAGERGMDDGAFVRYLDILRLHLKRGSRLFNSKWR